jgi:hypothetical protein
MIRINKLEHALSEKPLPLFRGMLYRAELALQARRKPFPVEWVSKREIER